MLREYVPSYAEIAAVLKMPLGSIGAIVKTCG
jgi:hypothetical protein